MSLKISLFEICTLNSVFWKSVFPILSFGNLSFGNQIFRNILRKRPRKHLEFETLNEYDECFIAQGSNRIDFAIIILSCKICSIFVDSLKNLLLFEFLDTI